MTGPLAGQSFPLRSPSITIGREAYNDIAVKGDLRVSRRHARLVCEAGVWSIENLSEQNPLFVDNQPVKRAVLRNKSIVIVGQDTSFIFHAQSAAQGPYNDFSTQALLGAPAQPAGAPAIVGPPTVAVPLAPPAPAPTVVAGAGYRAAAPGAPAPHAQTLVAASSNLGAPAVQVSSGTTGQRKTYVLDKPTLSVGRNATNDIVIEDSSVSDVHLQIVHEEGQFVLIHPHPDRQRTTNGLFYQGRKIRGDERYRQVLAPGDIFRIGDADGALVTLSYSDGSGTAQSAPPLQPIRLDKAEMTIGRTPDTTIVLNHPQVSATHAGWCARVARIASWICTARIMSM
jgi:pSer/pThr/pTyr-binding forkhead associated (FHA) protein